MSNLSGQAIQENSVEENSIFCNSMGISATVPIQSCSIMSPLKPPMVTSNENSIVQGYSNDNVARPLTRLAEQKQLETSHEKD